MDVVHDLDSGFGLEGGIALDDSTPLPVLKAGGFGASVDAYAGETDSDSTPPRTRLWVVSLHGSQQSVNEHWGHPATLHGSSFFVVSRLRGNSKVMPNNLVDCESLRPSGRSTASDVPLLAARPRHSPTPSRM